LLDRALTDFAIVPDRDLDLMRPDQRLADVTARALAAIADELGRDSPDIVLAQGDTTTTLATALACHFARVPFGHVEAGLRTGRPHDPFPEEKNRVVAGHLAELHFAPTPDARRNLRREGIEDGAIHVTGNTVIDALALAADRETPLPVATTTKRFLLVTVHRRENFGAPLERICDALGDLVRHDPALSVVCPVHPNPHVGTVIRDRLGELERVHLIEPVGYLPFVALMKAAALILTDSGGVQEEAPALGKPVLVLRETTERVEGIAEGEMVRLVGTRREAIVAAVREKLDRPSRRGPFRNPYGDGWASERIARVIAARFGIDPGPLPCGFSPRWPAGEG
jgi:UDP-N-acetylglucosamine 2-epimerase (non-hydrolysing)